MRTYKAIREFIDTKDNNRFYHVGDTYPRDGANVSNERISELSTNKNASKIPLIEEIRSKRTPYTDEINDED